MIPTSKPRWLRAALYGLGFAFAMGTLLGLFIGATGALPFPEPVVLVAAGFVGFAQAIVIHRGAVRITRGVAALSIPCGLLISFWAHVLGVTLFVGSYGGIGVGLWDILLAYPAIVQDNLEFTRVIYSYGALVAAASIVSLLWVFKGDDIRRAVAFPDGFAERLGRHG